MLATRENFCVVEVALSDLVFRTISAEGEAAIDALEGADALVDDLGDAGFVELALDLAFEVEKVLVPFTIHEAPASFALEKGRDRFLRVWEVEVADAGADDGLAVFCLGAGCAAQFAEGAAHDVVGETVAAGVNQGERVTLGAIDDHGVAVAATAHGDDARLFDDDRVDAGGKHDVAVTEGAVLLVHDARLGAVHRVYDRELVFDGFAMKEALHLVHKGVANERCEGLALLTRQAERTGMLGAHTEDEVLVLEERIGKARRGILQAFLTQHGDLRVDKMPYFK